MFSFGLAAIITATSALGADDCPDTANFTARVERITGKSAAGDGGGSTVVAVDFSRVGTSYQAALRLSGAREGVRTLRDEGATCDALADAVAVATAIMLDPTARGPADAHGGSVARPEASPSWGIWLVGQFGAGAGLVGGASVTAGAALQVSLGPLTLVHLGGALSTTREIELGAGTVDVALRFFETGAFRSLTGETFRLGPTVLFMAGALEGRGAGYPIASSETLPWLAFGAGARADVGFGPGVRFGARAVAVVPTRSYAFTVGYVGTAYESRQIAGIVDFVVDWRVW